MNKHKLTHILKRTHAHSEWESYSQLLFWRSDLFSDYSRYSKLPSHSFFSLSFCHHPVLSKECSLFFCSIKLSNCFFFNFLSAWSRHPVCLLFFFQFAFTPPWWNPNPSFSPAPSPPLSILLSFSASTINKVPLKHSCIFFFFEH